MSDKTPVETAMRAEYEFDQIVKADFGHTLADFEDLPEWAQQTHRDRVAAGLASLAQHRDEAVAVFKSAWHDADSEGKSGHRTEAGIDAVLAYLSGGAR